MWQLWTFDQSIKWQKKILLYCLIVIFKREKSFLFLKNWLQINNSCCNETPFEVWKCVEISKAAIELTDIIIFGLWFEFNIGKRFWMINLSGLFFRFRRFDHGNIGFCYHIIRFICGKIVQIIPSNNIIISFIEWFRKISSVRSCNKLCVLYRQYCKRTEHQHWSYHSFSRICLLTYLLNLKYLFAIILTTRCYIHILGTPWGKSAYNYDMR